MLCGVMIQGISKHFFLKVMNNFDHYYFSEETDTNSFVVRLLINLVTPVIVQSLKSSNGELGQYLNAWMGDCSSALRVLLLTVKVRHIWLAILHWLLALCWDRVSNWAVKPGGARKLLGGARNLWSHQHYGRCQAVLEIPVRPPPCDPSWANKMTQCLS